ncbi:MAG: hypothetical protein KDI90_06170 [Alphaproteobacteria bacterium]|nr:hypothetical protein [Alphaproteobacteria bacterium]MCB9975798.1 hypothetical protein [Rhodospirillales bacterium]
MLIRLGRMLNAAGQLSTVIDTVRTDSLSFLGPSMPSPFQYFRSDALATYRNSSGVLVQAAANEPRFDHSASGTPLGLLMEPSRQNKTSAYNASPVDLTGLTAGGNASAVIAVVDDTSNLTAAGLGSIGNGKVIEIDNAQGGSGTAYVTIAGTVGNTNAHSMSCYIYPLIGAGAIQLSDGGGYTAISSVSAYTLVQKHNITPTSTSRQMRLSCPIGHKARFLLWQLEEGTACTTPIITSGATATRQHNRILLTTLASLQAWNPDEGAMTVEFTPLNDGGDALSSDQYFILASNGTGVNDAFGVFGITPRMKARARVAAGGTQFANADTGQGFVKGKTYPAGITWQNGVSAKAFTGPAVFGDYTMSASASGFTRMYIGGRDTGNAIQGHVRTAKIFDQTRTLSQMASGLFSSNDWALAFSGQSNSVGYFSQQSDSTNGGERAMQPVLDAFWNAGTRNWLINGGTNGTSIGNWTAPSGTALARWKEIVGAYMEAGGQVKAIVWDQGEANQGDPVATLKSGWLSIFNDLRSFLAARGGSGNEPVIIIPIGRRTDADQDYRTLRQAQTELAAENAWIHLAPEKWHQTLDADGIHLADVGYAANGPHVVRKALKVLGESVSGGVDGPVISNVVRTGTTVTVTLSHDAGTDFTPTSGIEGFAFLDDGVPIAITAAVRTNATTITLTLASAPAGVEEVYHGYRSMYGVNPANLVRDNEATYPKPLRYHYEVL